MKKDAMVEQSIIVRLNQYTTEYMALEEEKERYYRQNVGKADRVVIETLYLRQYYIDGLIKRICKLVDILKDSKVEFDNECAKQLFDHYAPKLKRGFKVLLL